MVRTFKQGAVTFKVVSLNGTREVSGESWISIFRQVNIHEAVVVQDLDQANAVRTSVDRVGFRVSKHNVFGKYIIERLA